MANFAFCSPLLPLKVNLCKDLKNESQSVCIFSAFILHDILILFSLDF